jgi:hypothetical protein
MGFEKLNLTPIFSEPRFFLMTMAHISRDSLWTLETYAKNRNDFRAKVIAHKKNRTLHLGDHVTLIFEDELTIRYQIQEMLRIEKTFEESGIQDELDAYNPLIPDGTNLKATMMIEYPDADVRKRELAKLKGVEFSVYVQVDGLPKCFAVADEDMERENEEKTSSVHFLRFEFTPEMIASFKAGAAVAVGIDHPHAKVRVDEIAPAVQGALVRDFA